MEKVERERFAELVSWPDHCRSGDEEQELSQLVMKVLADSERCERLEGALGVIFNQVGAIENHLAEEHNDPFMRALCLKMMSIIEALGVPPANRETRESLEAYLAALEVPDGE